ncbi:hypothetical protein ACGC1H_000678 [Rhizoctonia solani]
MANPSREERDRDRERDRGHRSDRERRERTERSHHHHHRTISSTTLLLVLSLILAILAVMLSLPGSSRPTPSPSQPPVAAPGASVSGSAGPPAGQAPPQGAHGTEDAYVMPEPTGFWSHLSPKRGKDLVHRESLVAMREADLARREAELLAAPPIPAPLAVSCPPAPIQTVIDAYTFTVTHTIEPILPPPMPMETVTVVKETEVVREQLEPPPWYRPANPRFDEVLDRESKVAERERDIAMREDIVGRREGDATRREGWIMEQLLQLQHEPGGQVMDDEYVYEVPPLRRKLKVPRPL